MFVNSRLSQRVNGVAPGLVASASAGGWMKRELEAKLLARIRQFDFGAKDVDQMIVTWPVDFLPS